MRKSYKYEEPWKSKYKAVEDLIAKSNRLQTKSLN